MKTLLSKYQIFFKLIFLLTLFVGCINKKDKTQYNQLDVSQRDSIIFKTANLIKSEYVFKDVGSKISTELLENHNNGVYENIYSLDNLVESLKNTIMEISKDKHFKIRAIGSNNEQDDEEQNVLSEHGFKNTEMLQDSIAYFEFDHLPGSKKDLEYAEKVLSEHSNCKVIIFDVRENIGGSGDLVEHLCSYLFRDSLLLYTFHNREGCLMSNNSGQICFQS